ncbi:MAG: hypothetical protein V4671_24860 [Armatimonadota bacterium]
MPRFLMVSDAAAHEPRLLERRVRGALEPQGHTVETAADTEDAGMRLRHEDFSVLIVQVPSLWRCSEEVRLLLSAVSEIQADPARKPPGVLLYSDKGGDGAVAEGYMNTRFLMLLSHAFQASELRAVVRRMLQHRA